MFTLTTLRVVSLLRNSQHGGWDAWAIWNLHARFLFRAGPAWRLLDDPTLQWSAPSHPLLLPSLIARGWKFVGSEAALVPQAVALAFVCATVLLLAGALHQLRGRAHGALGGILLVSSSFFWHHGSSQWADTPVGYFMLAALVCVTVAEQDEERRNLLLWLAGLMAGLAAWTKDEGQVFLIVFLDSRALFLGLQRRWRQLLAEARPLLAGVFIPLLLLLWFKATTRSSSELKAFSKLTVVDRYVQVLSALAKELWTNCSWVVPAVGLALLTRRRGSQRGLAAFVVLVCVAMLPGIILGFVLTPKDLRWQIFVALKRVFIQVYPSIVFATLLALPTKAELLEAVGWREGSG